MRQRANAVSGLKSRNAGTAKAGGDAKGEMRARPPGRRLRRLHRLETCATEEGDAPGHPPKALCHQWGVGG